MTGPEHYRAAEDYLQDAAEAMTTERNTDAGLYLGFAQAHAMLAQAAATALEPARLHPSNHAHNEWGNAVLPAPESRCGLCGEAAPAAPGVAESQRCSDCRAAAEAVGRGWI